MNACSLSLFFEIKGSFENLRKKKESRSLFLFKYSGTLNCTYLIMLIFKLIILYN